MTILFLDFDGVLHPVGTPARGPGAFARKTIFEAALRDLGLENVEVVITSTWRLAIPLPKLKTLFSPDVAARIVGKTPDVDEPGDFPRYDEIRAWLKSNGAAKDWVAIDDDAEQFPPGISNVVFTDASIGFDERAAEALTRLLANPD